MAKIGRNEKCPCRSGKKYKHCCGRRDQNIPSPASPEQKMKITLMKSVRNIQQRAVEKKEESSELGVFFFYSTVAGDAWVLEMTDCDCIQVARDGVALEPPIDETSETIEVNWSHTFAFREKQLELTAYLDKSVQLLVDAPSQQINAAVRRIRKKFTKEQLDQVHLPTS
ncbi:MAG: SEC-C domain-containing protein [Deltaproteobacteria bacterium]|nr:SEC-C domain-containing protein [Deltaproteobacteria bacterium]MBW2659204.1 SEC-C domain-containing protein [Deltaproteobacteria bacterium]